MPQVSFKAFTLTVYCGFNHEAKPFIEAPLFIYLRQDMDMKKFVAGVVLFLLGFVIVVYPLLTEGTRNPQKATDLLFTKTSLVGIILAFIGSILAWQSREK